MKRFEDLGVRLGETLWNMLGGEETRPKVLTMANVKRYMYEVMEDNPMVVGCALSTSKKAMKEVIQHMAAQVPPQKRIPQDQLTTE